jgi:hypothetical protein
MSLKHTQRLIIQVDSLPRLDMTTFPQLLIVDELESILSKLLSCNNAGQVCQNFILLAKHSETVVCMDGLMEDRSIEYIRWIKNTSVPQIVLNTFKPRSDYKMTIHPYTKQNAEFIAA